MMLFEQGGPQCVLHDEDLKKGLYQALEAFGAGKKVLALPPDVTRIHSKAGHLTCWLYEYYGDALTDIMPTLGTHTPMNGEQINRMFPGIPHSLFREHQWRHDLCTLGRVPSSFVNEVSGGLLDWDWPAQVNRLLSHGGHDVIFSPGQVVPHEVMGMANHAKNIFIGAGGAEAIHKSHFLGAVCGMERIMGRTDTPVRAILDYGMEHFASHLPIVFALTVLGPDVHGSLVVRGLYIGTGRECFEKAAALSREVNFSVVSKPFSTCVVNLDPVEYRSTWLGNKAIYRTRMAMADGGKLIILAPGLKEFGEDSEIDEVIRRYGYQGTDMVLDAVKNHKDLSGNLAAAAHLIHGSTEGRFDVVYAPGKGMSQQEVESVGYSYASYEDMAARYDSESLKPGWNQRGDEEIFYVSNPALGLWAHSERLIF
ncbi:MAG: D-mannonate epimerase [Spirochaetales bacterium]|nr:D-mannonate epimerase [Spirochaetales bacterium]